MKLLYQFGVILAVTFVGELLYSRKYLWTYSDAYLSWNKSCETKSGENCR